MKDLIVSLLTWSGLAYFFSVTAATVTALILLCIALTLLNKDHFKVIMKAKDLKSHEIFMVWIMRLGITYITFQENIPVAVVYFLVMTLTSFYFYTLTKEIQE